MLLKGNKFQETSPQKIPEDAVEYLPQTISKFMATKEEVKVLKEIKYPTSMGIKRIRRFEMTS